MMRLAADPAEAAKPPDSAALYERYVHRVARWAERLAGPGWDLEDIVHEVFFIAHRELPRFRGHSTLETWLFGITDNVVRHRRRKERWRRWLTGPAEEIAKGLPSPQLTPVELVEQAETARTVYLLLDKLSERDRRVLILFELEEMSAEEVGALLGIRPANARLRLHRARARFQRVYLQLEQAEARKGRKLVHAEPI